jgi:hypothetical protein
MRVARALVKTLEVSVLDSMAQPSLGGLSQAENRSLTSLMRDGFVNLGSSPVPLEESIETSRRIFDAHEREFAGVTRFYVKHPFLVARAHQAILKLEQINRLVRAYLGPQATFDRMLLSRIPASAAIRKVSSLWHHDWCGRRLKLFVLLQDVDEVGRPTLYAVGSHRKIRWANFVMSRFDDEYVLNRYEIRPLTGRRGDFVLLDTNGLHRATGEANRPSRDALTYEFSSYRKGHIMGRQSLEIGIRQDLFDSEFDPAGCLVRAADLVPAGRYLMYGTLPQLVDEPHIDGRLYSIYG